MFLSRLDRLVPDLFETLRRFPVAVLAALGLCIYMNIYVVRHNNVQQWNIVLAFVAAFMAGGAGHLFAEGLRFSRVRGLAIALIAGLAAAALMYFNVALHASECFCLADWVCC
jgi:peptidoglycan/LPS O-acetylase OafA/YrhL